MEQGHRFPKSRRLTRSLEFQRVRAEGQAARGSILTVSFLQGADQTQARAGVIASRRVGNAVVRNRARRRLREIFRKHQNQIRAGVWVVTIVSARAARASFATLEDEWLRLMKRASILAP